MKQMCLLLLQICVIVFSDKIIYNKYQLRGMFEKEKTKQFHAMIDDVYSNIYNGVIQKAIIGKTKLIFTLDCNRIDERYQHHEEDAIDIALFIRGSSYNLIDIYHISVEEIEKKIIDKLQSTFVDSNFTKKDFIYKNNVNKNINKNINGQCLSYYTISW